MNQESCDIFHISNKQTLNGFKYLLNGILQLPNVSFNKDTLFFISLISNINLLLFLKVVVLMDPQDDPDDVLRANRSREKNYAFDVVFDGSASQVC